ncbi:alcohol dehydrogenase catalytic domain-containing protein [Enterococcus hulanensis]|uniref:zinc-dependent alcohol dehydrogenase n=1 Tax=Enterococcus hulanensis TaxID=2559929 RepID=UPI001A8E6A96|nr:alcohol dehydrogenase catalytic domain-containing protein [Enterococcus hulanensis]MBO0456156.1 alcohol dehydrogenase catalytic domain-containing protein [Enterococcus hulanensis]
MKINKMTFSVLTKAGQTEIRERELPPIGKNQVLVKNLACNICTTDYGQWLGLREHQGYPMAGGHESSGEIVALGEGVTDFEVGDKVALAYDGCGECTACRKNDFLHCANEDSNKKTEDGYLGTFGFANYSVRNTRALIKMNKILDPSEAAFLEPLATVCKGLKKLRIKPFETVVVIGGGTMGLLNAVAAKAYACRVIVTEMMEKKIKTAQSMGLEVIDAGKYDPAKKVVEMTDGEGADVVIIAAGVTQANNQAFEIVKKTDGRILFFAAGYPSPDMTMDSNTIHYRRMELIGTFAADNEDFFTAGDLLNSGRVQVTKLLEEKRFKLADSQKAFELASKPGMFRVSIRLQE